MNPLFLNTILLGGSTNDKLRAAKDAGFAQIELWRQDIESADGQAVGVAATLRRLSLGLTDFQVLLDFDGAPADTRERKRAEALWMLDTAAAVGATTLLAPASTDPRCVAQRIGEDLQWLAREAARRDLRVAYEAMAWSTIHHAMPDAWRMVSDVGEANLGLVVDAFHVYARHRTAADLDGIPAERIFLVQLSDLEHDVASGQLIDTARHRRLLPGQGHFPLADLLRTILAKGYAGPIGLEVFNDEMKALPPAAAAASAMTALRTVLECAADANAGDASVAPLRARPII